MQIDGIDNFELGDRSFCFRGHDFLYSSVTGLTFSATVTQHSVNGIPSGKSYNAELTIHLGAEKVAIEPARGWFGRMKAAGMEAVQRAYSILSQLTFAYRVEPYETQFEKKGYFEHFDLQFHKDGHIFQRGREIGSVREEDFILRLSPFRLHLVRDVEGFRQKLIKKLSNRDVNVDLSYNRDCVLYMVRRAYGLSWKSEFIPEKRVDRERLFYETVVRFGAILANVDGHADSSELVQLKRFFELDDEKLPGAARIFNESLHARANIENVLGSFAKEFAGASELKESFLVGMLTVALADSVFDPREYDLIRKAAHRLGLTDGAFERILAAVGLAGVGFGHEGTGQDAGRKRSSPKSAAEVRISNLKMLGLANGADRDAIVSAYRNLARRYHPDILRGQGMPENEIEKAEAILVQINLTYEALAAESA